MGLQGLVDYSGGNTTTFQNITRSSNYWANSYVDVTGEALSVADMTTAMLECRTGKPDAAFANKTLVEKYHSLLSTNRRIVNTIQLVDGWTGLEVAANGRSIPLVLDFQAPEGEMYFIDSTKFVIGELSPMNWLDEGEGILKWIQGKAAYEAIMTYYAQLMTTHPKAHAALRNKTA
jgi:hypothetical protein